MKKGRRIISLLTPLTSTQINDNMQAEGKTEDRGYLDFPPEAGDRNSISVLICPLNACFRSRFLPTPFIGFLIACCLSRNLSENQYYFQKLVWASQVAQMVKKLLAMQETWVSSLAWEDSLEKGMDTHFSILAWEIPWTEEPGGLQSMGSQRVGHD